jgi:hypothetical protein
MSEDHTFGEILGPERAARVLDLIEAELTRRNLPRQTDGDTLHLLTPGGIPATVSLSSLARKLAVPGADDAEIVAQLFTVNEAATGVDLDRPLRADNLKVQLRPRSYLDENPTMVWQPWWPGLLLVLVVDCGEYVRSVVASELESLDRDPTELEELARRNVWEQNQPRRHRVPGDATGAVMLEGDLFASTFALWPGRFCEIDEGRGVLIAVPNRNCTLLKPVRQGGTQADIRLFGEWAHMAYTHEAGPVTSSVFWVPGDGGEAGDPEAIELRVTPGPNGRADVTIPRPVKERLV